MARGDDEFADFVRASSARLTHAAFLLTGDRHQAEDAAQAPFPPRYAAWWRVRHKDAYGYARTVLMNHVIDGWRRPIREYATETMPEGPDRGDVDKAVTQREWLTSVLKTLTDRERAVVVLRHFFDLPEADVARALGVSLGTVKSTNSRALAKLRVEVGPEDTLFGGSGR